MNLGVFTLTALTLYRPLGAWVTVLHLTAGEPITDDLLSERIVSAHARSQQRNGVPPATLAGMVAKFERTRIVEVLAACGGNKSEAARRFGLTYRGLLAKMQRLGCA